MGQRRKRTGAVWLSGLTLLALAALFVTMDTVVPVLDHWPLTAAYGALVLLVSGTLLTLAPRVARASVLAVVIAFTATAGLTYHALNLSVANAGPAEGGAVVIVTPKWQQLVATRETVSIEGSADATIAERCDDLVKPLGVSAPILSLPH